MWCVVVCDLETSLMRPWPTGGGGLSRQKQTKTNWNKTEVRKAVISKIKNTRLARFCVLRALMFRNNLYYNRNN